MVPLPHHLPGPPHPVHSMFSFSFFRKQANKHQTNQNRAKQTEKENNKKHIHCMWKTHKSTDWSEKHNIISQRPVRGGKA